ncbi:hypothetical protein DET50_1113 [Marinobacter pelagius]|uniref:HEPN AbiU2-like domain-containing protein n=1 Tax=Marinobacter pelagius TaxID=379482 RepID=A0A366GPN6_9GAMM|nr:hypothetical protein DET50_1113 [Marinobacter pelagius]
MDLAEFDRMTEKLVSELQAAYMFFEMYRAIEDEIPHHSKAMNKSKHFWSLTRNAHLEATRATLARIYDQDEKNLSVRSWLNKFKIDHLKDEYFQSNDLDSFCRKPLVAGEIDEDIKSVSDRDPLVKTLYIRHRHTEIAHLSLKNAQKGVSFFERYPLSRVEIQSLIDRAAELINKYSAHHSGKTYAMTTFHSKDYKYVFDKISGS